MGHGSFANVYKVVRKRDGEIFAVKKSRSSFAGMADRKRKLIEVQNMWILKGMPMSPTLKNLGNRMDISIWYLSFVKTEL